MKDNGNFVVIASCKIILKGTEFMLQTQIFILISLQPDNVKL